MGENQAGPDALGFTQNSFSEDTEFAENLCPYQQEDTRGIFMTKSAGRVGSFMGVHSHFRLWISSPGPEEVVMTTLARQGSKTRVLALQSPVHLLHSYNWFSH